jgi:hypothetical protein
MRRRPSSEARSGRIPGIPQGAALPEFAYQAALLSLPYICHTTLETVPADMPYLSAEPGLIDAWGKELEALPGFKIGIAWQGSKGYQDDAYRSIKLANFEALSKVKGVRINLQKGFGLEQLSEARSMGIIDFGKRLDEQGGFLDTAAIMKHLDLVITPDTSIAHLAGALDVPVWVALGKAADWRWLLGRDDSPWYPSMRLFRQKKRGEWREVFERMAEALRLDPALETAELHARSAFEFIPIQFLTIVAGDREAKDALIEIAGHEAHGPVSKQDVETAASSAGCQPPCLRCSPTSQAINSANGTGRRRTCAPSVRWQCRN